MTRNLASSLRNYAQTAAANPRSAALTLIVVIVTPGGFLIPACYAVYQALRHTFRK